MVELWYCVVAGMITIYVVLDGRNFGVGVLHFLVGRNRQERRQVIAAIGPLWVWHEVWLVAFGGTLFVAFPVLLGTAFSGYYLALNLILWCLILRAAGIEAGGHLDDPMWQGFWDVVLTASSVLLCMLFGLALGNMARGVPVDDKGEFAMTFFTTFRTRGDVGLIDWYTISVAVTALIFLTAHGASYLVLRTTGVVHDRCEKLQRMLWGAVPVFLIIVTIETLFVRDGLVKDFLHAPLAWLGAIGSAIGVVLLVNGMATRNELRAFMGSGTVIGSVLFTGAATIFPVILFSTVDPKNSITAQAAAASTSSLELAAIWWPIAAILTLSYFWYMRKRFAGKIDLVRERMGPY
jgi:cytochrome d ubiquinol oxidase subunit II